MFRDEVGKNLAFGVGEGFADTMKDVTSDMTDAIPSEFDTAVNINGNVNASPLSQYDSMVSAFKKALAEVKIVLNDKEMGGFVNETIERAVFA